MSAILKLKLNAKKINKRNGGKIGIARGYVRRRLIKISQHSTDIVVCAFFENEPVNGINLRKQPRVGTPWFMWYNLITFTRGELDRSQTDNNVIKTNPLLECIEPVCFSFRCPFCSRGFCYFSRILYSS